MTEKFPAFAQAVRARFAEMSSGPLFVVDSDHDGIWQAYLDAFPPGSNPIFRERTEHDCSCCRHWIRDIGSVVAIQNGALVSVWDLNALPDPYQQVADSMAAHVKALPIRDVFLTPLAKHGQETTNELGDGGTVRTWNHFSSETPSRFVCSEVATRQGAARTTFGVLMRGFTELTPDAVATVADLIESNALYRGEEHKRAVLEFQQMQSRFLAVADERARELIAWTLVESPVARLRNTAIGTLIQDLSGGMALEAAVRKFEAMVAPQNYKRLDVGFTVEIESARGIEVLHFAKAVASKNNQQVAEIVVKNGEVAKIRPAPGMFVGSRSQEKWGLKTLTSVRVNAVILSPNYWEDEAGNKHWFFILEGCKNPLPTRGIYNEFLHPKLTQHRKVFEVLGDKTKCPFSEDQLSGLGFSSTRKDKVSVIAMGPDLHQAYTIAF